MNFNGNRFFEFLYCFYDTKGQRMNLLDQKVTNVALMEELDNILSICKHFKNKPKSFQF